MALYEAVIKVNRNDTPAKRGNDIAEGIGYACALLADEYLWVVEDIVRVLETAIDDAYERESAD